MGYSTEFIVNIGQRFKLGFINSIGTGTGGQPFLPNPKLGILDRGNNIVLDSDGYIVTASILPNSANAVLLPATNLNVAVSQGMAIFQGLYINPTGGFYLSFSVNLVIIS